MPIEPKVWVTLKYRLFDSQGEPIEDHARQIGYLHGGYGAVFPRIEQALEGRRQGESVTVHLEPEDSFGDYDASRLRLAPREHFPDQLEAGMTFEGVPGEPPDGELYIVTDVAGDTVVLDANHPLAGMSLRFEIEIVALRSATPEEIEREALADDSGPGMFHH